jgi:DUF4097 and DUF4098 domain-containing protein YvlB
MFSTESNMPAPKSYSYTETDTKKVIKLDETERFEQSYPLNSSGRVSVSNVNGSITIETWDKNEVKLVAVKTANDKERLAEVEIQIDAKPDYLRIETDYGSYDDRRRRNWGNADKLQIEYHLTVPRNAVLNEIETVNGSVRISNATNLVRASAVNGEVAATNLRGTANLSTVNGTVNADFDQLQTGSKITLETVNGNVNLLIPSDANATFRADSLNGVISNDFGLPVRKGQYVGRDLYGKVGTGDVQIRLNSVNGPLSIKRKADGKNPNPAVNMLQQKSEDDDDMDDDSDNDNSDEDNWKAMAKSQKGAEKAARQAQREINKIKPEIAKATADAVKQSTATIATDIATDVSTSISTSVSTSVTVDMQRRIQEAQRQQRAALADINWINGAPVIEKTSDSFAVKGAPKVTVDAVNCDVSVRGWDKNEVKYFISKISKDRNQTPIQYTADHTDSAVNIKVANALGEQKGDFYNPEVTRVLVEVYVPKKSNLRIVTNREIRLEGVSGDLDLSGSEGAINVRDSEGKLRLYSDCGKIRVIGFDGEVDAKTISGTVSLEGNFTKISGKADEGSFILTLPENADADIAANLEEISIENLPAPKQISEGNWRFGKGGAKYDFTLGDGQVYVRNANALKTN